MAIAGTLAHFPSTETPTIPKTSLRLTGSWRLACSPRAPPPLSSTEIGASAAGGHCRRLLSYFDPAIPLREAVTPPSSWYTDPSFLALELDRVFFRGWQAVGFTEQIKNAHDFFTGRLGNVEFVICRGAQGELHGFHNVCRHHASLLVRGSGQKSCFQCPYHGWTYGLDGALLKATRITGIRNFNKNDFGLVPVNVATWGPFVLINVNQESLPQHSSTQTVENVWLGSASEVLSKNGVDTSLKHVCRREYTIECNWKVFCDNYLDGGYHVPYAHGGLASGLKLDSYTTDDDKEFIQKSLEESERVQIEDIALCEGVQKGLESPSYSVGRYAPTVEKAMHHFHCLLHADLK